MSSIYKKGRDGYYYYQTYIYNPESKKKDKRIFHALGTKNLLEAKTKQSELDLQYDNQNHNKTNPLISFYNLHPKKTVAIIVGIIPTIVLLVDFYRPGNVKQNSNSSILAGKGVDIEERIDVLPKANDSINIIVNNQIDYNIENIPEKINTIPESKIVEPKVIIPKYFVERVDRLSGAFAQGKVYVTIDKNSSNESQKLLCKNLTKRYSEFSNIVICLYSNDRAGKDLAKGNNETVSIEEQKRSWLAMYTFNSVEGEYFDNNPSGYLGIY